MLQEHKAEPQLDFRGVVLDLDGTALRADHSLSPLMIRLGERLRGWNVWLTLASARPPRSVRRFADQLGSPGPWIALNGAIVVNASSEIIWRRSLSPEATALIRDRCLGDPNVSTNVYSGFEWMVDGPSEEVDSEATIVGFGPTLLPDTWPPVDKLLLIVPCGEETRYAAELRSMSVEISVTVSKRRYIEVTHAQATKGSALRVAAAQIPVATSALIAAGDGENDVPMLAECGFPIAMGHSPEETRRIARHVVGSNDDDSLPLFLEKLLGSLEFREAALLRARSGQQG